MHIYTKFGDTGHTSTGSGRKVSKSDLRIGAVGDVDELNAFLGLIVAFTEDAKLASSLKEMQRDLFVIGAMLSGARGTKLNASRVNEFENEIDRLEGELPPLKNFILPGGSKTASMFHLARTVCRRAERSVAALMEKERLDPQIIVYLNRLGDLLFMLARMENRRKRKTEEIWNGK